MRWNVGLAWGIALLGLGLLGWAWRELGWRRWLDLDDTPPDAALPRLVLYGPFRLVRHPQALGLLCLTLAAALRWRRPGMWLAAFAAAAVVIWLTLRDDEDLADRFGEAYARYRRAVGLLLPRLW